MTGPCQTDCKETTARSAAPRANGRGSQTVVLLGMGIHNVAIQLETFPKDLISAGDEVFRKFLRGNRRGEGTEVESAGVGSRGDVKGPIGGWRDEARPRRVDVDQGELPGWEAKARSGCRNCHAACIGRAVVVDTAKAQSASPVGFRPIGSPLLRLPDVEYRDWPSRGWRANSIRQPRQWRLCHPNLSHRP